MKFEQLLLLKLAEEASEVAQRASKAIQFGLGEVQPGQELDNADRLTGEVIDFLAVLDMLVDRGMIVLPGEGEFRVRVREKNAKILKYARMSHQRGELAEDPDALHANAPALKSVA